MNQIIKVFAGLIIVLLFSGDVFSQEKELPSSEFTPPKKELANKQEVDARPLPPAKPDIPDTREVPDSKKEEFRKAEERAYQPAVVVYPPESQQAADNRPKDKKD